jgi:hypothetical protein
VRPLTLDTDADTERRQIEAWRNMSAADKAAIVTGLTNTAFELALAGIRDRYPAESARHHWLRLAVLTLGSDLARRVYPEIVTRGLAATTR